MKKEKILAVAKWFIGLFFALLALVYLTESILTAILSSLLALIVIPPTSRRIFSRIKYPIPRWGKYGLAIVLFFMVMVATPSTEDPKPEPVAQEQVDKNEPQAVKPNEGAESEVFLAGQTAPNNPELALAKVIRVIDGDTIEVDVGGGEIKKVRYIGMNAPETEPKECYSTEATNKNKELVEGGIVGLEKDVSETDRYDRLLRYVYMGDMFVNQALVVEGFAHAQAYPPDTKYQDQLTAAANTAKTEKRGLWTACVKTTPTPALLTPKPTTAPQTQTAPVQSTAPANTSGYSCTGPDLDCKDFKTHAEAQAFFDGCGWSKDNDPMRLDGRYAGQGDGVACESLP